MSQGRVHDKICLVTGAASGIGRAIAELLANEGATSIIADIDLRAAKVVLQSILDAGQLAEVMELDVTQDSAWRSVIGRTVANYNRLDVLVNCAGISISRPIADCSLEDWRRLMSVNLDGVFLGTRHAITAMTNGGSIVNVASVSGIKPAAGAAAYCASKAAIRMLSRVAAIECADQKLGIRVNVVSPGGVRTPMWEKEDFFKALIQEHGSIEGAFAAMEGDARSEAFFAPDEVAETVLNLVSDASSHLTGVEIVMDRGHSG